MKGVRRSSKIQAVEAETLETELGLITVKRRKGRRRLSIILHPLRPIEVRSNLRTSDKQITEFLLLKRTWIEKNQQQFKNMRETFPDKRFEEGEVFSMLGKSRVLKFIQSPDRKLRGWIQGEQIILSRPVSPVSEKQLQKTLRDLYKKISIAYLEQRVQVLSQRMQCLPSNLSFGEAKSRWGSCQATGEVRLNWKLIVFEPRIIDYVVIHELAHLKHLDHSVRFWKVVETHEPQYRSLRKKLKESEFQVAFLEKSKAGNAPPTKLAL